MTNDVLDQLEDSISSPSLGGEVSDELIAILRGVPDAKKDWVKVKLSDIATVQTGPFGSQLHERDYVSEGIPIITVENLREDRITDDGSTPRVGGRDYKRLAKYTLAEGDVVFSRVGSVDRCGYVDHDQNGWMFSGRLLRVRPDLEQVHKYFLFLALSSSSTKSYIRKVAVGATMPSINTKILSELAINLPPLHIQKQIAGLLSVFDKKIELLRAQNKTLESIAQVIYKRWFVDFEFPDENGNPYKSSGGKMKPSELDDIPIDWNVKGLNDVVDSITGYSYKGNELKPSKVALITLKSFNRIGGFEERGFKPFMGTPKKEHEVMVGDVIVAHTDLTQDGEVIGNAERVSSDGGFKKMYITMDLVKVVSKNEAISREYIYSTLRTKRFKSFALGSANGSTVLHLSKSVLPSYRVAIPTHLGMIEDFTFMSRGMLEKTLENNKGISIFSRNASMLKMKLFGS